VAYVVTKTAGVWRQVAELKPPHGSNALLAVFGSSVAVSGTTAVVGDQGQIGGQVSGGVAYVFEA
jgi:hypothetical protein